MYNCEIAGCQWEGAIRTTIRDRDSNHYGKKVCPFHASIIKNVKKNNNLNDYFKYHIEKIRKGARCEETGNSLEPTRFHICHIFPKRKYKSVGDNKINCVYLTWQCHHDLDRLLDNLEFDKLVEKFPNSWGKICERAKELLPLIEEEGNLKEKFKTYLNV